jgi:DNA adenine methylase
MKPFFKWAGGKRSLLPHLVPAIGEMRDSQRYFEPFVGGGAVFFELRRLGFIGKAFLTDINPHLIAAYLAVRDDPARLIRALTGYAVMYKERGAEFYYAARAEQIDPIAQAPRAASRFLFLNRTCFNGLWRVNKKDEFNVPHGKWKTPPTICDETAIMSAHAALQNTFIGCCSYAAHEPRAGDVWYADPPYWPVSTTADFTAYSCDGFGPRDQEKLCDVARRLKGAGVRVVLSNADMLQVRELYGGFNIQRVEARRNINSKGGKRGAVGEVLIT